MHVVLLPGGVRVSAKASSTKQCRRHDGLGPCACSSIVPLSFAFAEKVCSSSRQGWRYCTSSVLWVLLGSPASISSGLGFAVVWCCTSSVLWLLLESPASTVYCLPSFADFFCFFFFFPSFFSSFLPFCFFLSLTFLALSFLSRRSSAVRVSCVPPRRWFARTSL